MQATGTGDLNTWYWIGLERQSDTEWYWSDGNPSGFREWSPGKIYIYLHKLYMIITKCVDPH